MPITLLILICGIAIYPIGLQMGLTSYANKPASVNYYSGEDYALLNALTAVVWKYIKN